MSATDQSLTAGEPALALIHQTLLGEALEHSPMLAFVADEDMRYVAVNSRVCERLGYTRQEILGLQVSDIADDSSAPEEFAQMVATGHRSGTAMLRAKTGERVPFSYFAAETRVAGVVFYFAFGVVPGTASG